MTYGRFKSRRRSRTYVKTATQTKIVHSKHPKEKRNCIGCGTLIIGKPARMFSGVLCGACVRQTVKGRAKAL